MTLPAGLTSALAEDKARAIALFSGDVSHETWERLDRLVALVLARQQVMNLIAPSTVAQIWTRHIADCLQLIPCAPAALRWADLGSGAGFPGLVIACALADTPGAAVHLVESTKKKAAFLSDVVQDLKLPATVHPVRIEDFTRTNRAAVDAVTARALAPLMKLLDYAIPLLKRGAIGVFPKGQDVEAELTEASKYWTMEIQTIPSKTDPRGRLVVVRHARKRQATVPAG
jgi:16S rRNA (guanine527-N7)-methyltransferase